MSIFQGPDCGHLMDEEEDEEEEEDLSNFTTAETPGPIFLAML